MRSRNILHLNKLDDFTAYAEARGFFSDETRGEFEVLRLRHHFPHKATMLFFKTLKNVHVTAQGERAVKLVNEYIADKKEGKWKDGKFQ